MNEAERLPLITKPTIAVAATNKADGLAAQNDTIAAASIGGVAFRSAATLLVTVAKVDGYQK
ncbi:MAG: hypothetical protein WCS52_03040 [bacterium]